MKTPSVPFWSGTDGVSFGLYFALRLYGADMDDLSLKLYFNRQQEHAGDHSRIPA